MIIDRSSEVAGDGDSLKTVAEIMTADEIYEM